MTPEQKARVWRGIQERLLDERYGQGRKQGNMKQVQEFITANPKLATALVALVLVVLEVLTGLPLNAAGEVAEAAR